MAKDPLNMEFVRLLASSGWSQSAAAEKLKLSPASISQYVSGETRPSLTVLKLFKLMIGDATPLPGDLIDVGMHQRDMPRPLEDWEADLIDSLRTLEPDKRKRILEGLKLILAEIPRREVNYRSTPQTKKSAA